MLRINRDSGYVDNRRAYKIVLDKKVIGEIRDGQQVDKDVSRGEHKLYLRIDWCRSNIEEFEYDGGTAVEFECGSNLRGWRLLLSILYVTILRTKYIWLKRKL